MRYARDVDELMWFCWERSPRGWAPVVFHIEKPRASDSRMIMCEVPGNLAPGGDPMFGLLVERYPAPPAEPRTGDVAVIERKP